MFFTFGNITFEGIKLPQSFEGNFETLYGQTPIIGGKPVVQNTGEKLDEYNITAYFHTDFCKPRNEVNKIQQMRIAGTVDYLVDGTGKNYGRFVITTLETQNVSTLDNGYETSISISIHLLEYNTNSDIVKQDGEALLSNNPISVLPLNPKISTGVSITKDLSEAGKINKEILSVTTQPSNGMFNKISTLADNAKAYYTTAQNKIENTKKIIYRATDLQSSITMVKSALQDIKSASDIKSFSDLLTANNKLSYAIEYLEKSKIPLVAFIGSREGGE